MAKTPDAVRTLLMSVWPPARERVLSERDRLQEAARQEGGNFKIAAWDWRYYSEKVRKAEFDLDAAAIKPYLPLERIIEAAFACATRLFGLTFSERKDVPVYHPEVRVWEVKNRSGRHVGLFYGDHFARPSKRSGAWMTSFRGQHGLDAHGRKPETPIILNVMNFAKASPGEPALLSMDDARTLFHEFGHGLHGLLSSVVYPAVSGTSVSRDFVELPSQLYEHWLAQPAVLKEFARHYKTGAPMPDAMIERLEKARTFNQGFATSEYLASSLFDLDAHTLTDATAIDVDALEKKTLSAMGLPEEISMRHRPAHFQHITGGYAAGYYSYMWSEVLDADAFRAFEEKGDIFDASVAQRLHDHIYSAGARREAADAYIAFRGRLPAVDALLAKKGLVRAATG
jgi:peptidyl-dipeptidase Dcp